MARKNKKSILEYNGIEIDSVEEWQIFCWLEEASKLGIVKSFEYQPSPFILTSKYTYIPYFNNQKNKEKHLLQPHIYTCDFKIIFNLDYIAILNTAFKIDKTCVNEENNEFLVYCDVKGSFNKFGGDRLFSVHQKLVFEKYGIYIEKVVPKKIFEKIGITPRLLKTPTGKISKIFGNYNLITTIFDKK